MTLSTTSNLIFSLIDLPVSELKALSKEGYFQSSEWHVPELSPGDAAMLPTLGLRLDSHLFFYNVSAATREIDLAEVYAIKGQLNIGHQNERFTVELKVPLFT